MEEWRSLAPEFPGYQISSYGRLMLLNGTVSKASPGRDEYTRVTLRNSTRNSISAAIHILVAKKFIDNPDNKPIVNHKNGKRFENYVWNLEWVTQAENMSIDRVKNPNFVQATRKVNQYTKEWIFVQTWNSIQEAAEGMRCDKSTICSACNGRLMTAKGFQWRYHDEMTILEGERWDTIFYNNVQVWGSTLGRILTPAKWMSYGSGPKNGYLVMNVGASHIGIHRIICSIFKPQTGSENLEVNHIDNNKHNNRFENLEWITRSENVRHAQQFKTNFTTSSRRIGQYDMRNNLIREFESITEASRITKVCRNNISKVCIGKRGHAGMYIWKHLDSPVSVTDPRMQTIILLELVVGGILYLIVDNQKYSMLILTVEMSSKGTCAVGATISIGNQIHAIRMDSNFEWKIVGYDTVHSVEA